MIQLALVVAHHELVVTVKVESVLLLVHEVVVLKVILVMALLVSGEATIVAVMILGWAVSLLAFLVGVFYIDGFSGAVRYCVVQILNRQLGHWSRRHDHEADPPAESCVLVT